LKEQRTEMVAMAPEQRRPDFRSIKGSTRPEGITLKASA